MNSISGCRAAVHTQGSRSVDSALRAVAGVVAGVVSALRAEPLQKDPGQFLDAAEGQQRLKQRPILRKAVQPEPRMRFPVKRRLADAALDVAVVEERVVLAAVRSAAEVDRFRVAAVVESPIPIA